MISKEDFLNAEFLRTPRGNSSRTLVSLPLLWKSFMCRSPRELSHIIFFSAIGKISYFEHGWFLSFAGIVKTLPDR